jgi:hypothetical protein
MVGGVVGTDWKRLKCVFSCRNRKNIAVSCGYTNVGNIGISSDGIIRKY